MSQHSARHTRGPFAAVRRSAGARIAVAAVLGGVAVSGHTSPTHAMTVNRPFVAMASTPDGHGYWLVGGDGGVFPFGDAGGYGSAANLALKAPVVAIAATPSGHGYWLAASDGGVFPFGDAVAYGAATGSGAHVVGIAASPSGHGYWLAGSDGSVRAYGDAALAGSASSVHLAAAVVGIAATPSGNGYWLVAGDGGVFPFGNAQGVGSAAGHPLNAAVVGLAPTPTGGGYWLTAADGGVFPFGDAIGYGSAAGVHLVLPVHGVSAAAGGHGYWLVAGDGGVFPFGPDAPGLGSLGGSTVAALQNVITATLSGGLGVADIVRAAAARHGLDAGWVLKIMYCESGGRVNAYNPAGPYVGLFQFLPSTFYANGGHNLYDAADQAQVATTMLSHGQAHQWGCA